jgi:hypothetical protein|tara:strand:+ start:296 stop:1087 length:792 start_codon:yes stop_codon:yes gene_type:complete
LFFLWLSQNEPNFELGWLVVKRSAMAKAAAALLACTAMTPLALPVAAQSSRVARPLSETAAKQAADQILEAVRQRDGQLRYSQFSTALQKTSSPSMVQGTLDQLPQLESWTIQSVRTGLSGNSSVEVLLESENGKREATLVINPKGRLVAQLFNVADKDSTKVARAFMDAVSDGQFISARSLLALDLQKEISPQALQNKWLGLQKTTGNFQKIEKVMEAEHGSNGSLVLVTVRFNRTTDNIFVILNPAGQITGLDFPIDGAVR